MPDVDIEVYPPPAIEIEVYPLTVFVTSGGGTGSLTDPYTGFTGGTTDDLDSETTFDLSLNALRFVIVDVALTGWNLVSGTDAEDVEAGIIRPDDFALTTNEKVWKRVLGF